MTQTTADAVPYTATTRTELHGWWSRRPWLRLFLGGLGLWVTTVLVTFATHNANLVPTIILLGSFLVPVAFVTYVFGHASEVVTPSASSPPSSMAGCWACSVLGAAVGFGFAALESAGYAFNALFTIVSWALLALDGLVGLLVLRRRWRRAAVLDRPATSRSG